MTEQRRRLRLWAGAVPIAAIVAAAGCSSSGSSGAANSGVIGIQSSPQWVTVENRAATPLTDVLIEIVPAGTQVTFTTRYYRLEAGEKRDFATNTFKSPDNTPFNVLVGRPKAIRVRATDASGNILHSEVPWRK